MLHGQLARSDDYQVSRDSVLICRTDCFRDGDRNGKGVACGYQ